MIFQDTKMGGIDYDHPHLDMRVVARRAQRRDCERGGQAEGVGRDIYLNMMMIIVIILMIMIMILIIID